MSFKICPEAYQHWEQFPGRARARKIWVAGEVLTAEALNKEFERVCETIKRQQAPSKLEQALEFLGAIWPIRRSR